MTGTRKNGNGLGSVYQKGDTGQWVAAITGADGRKRTRTTKFEHKAREALKDLTRSSSRPADAIQRPGAVLPPL